jgi:hypothetical protein
MWLTDWLRDLFRGPAPRELPPEASAHEQLVVEKIAAHTGQTPQQVREAARRRALALEVRSVRRDR